MDNVSDKKDPFLSAESTVFKVGCSDFVRWHSPAKENAAALLLCVRGHARLEVELISCSLTPCSQVIVFPHTVVRLSECSADFQMRYIFFEESVFIRLFKDFDEHFMRFIASHPHYQIEEEEHYQSLLLLFEQIRSLHEDQRNIHRDRMIYNLLLNRFLDIDNLIHHEYTNAEIVGCSQGMVIFRRFLVLLHRNICQQRSVEFYARELCVCSKYLYNIVRQYSGKSAKEMIDERAILEIKTLIRGTRLSFSQIADRMNFPSVSNFGRFFKMRTGYSPKSYREQQTLS